MFLRKFYTPIQFTYLCFIYNLKKNKYYQLASIQFKYFNRDRYIYFYIPNYLSMEDVCIRVYSISSKKIIDIYYLLSPLNDVWIKGTNSFIKLNKNQVVLKYYYT